MVYIYIGILGLYLVLFLLSLRESGNPFRKMAAHIYRRQQGRQNGGGSEKRNWRRALYVRQLGDKLKILQPQIAVQKQIREHYLSLYGTVLTVVFVGNLLCLAAWLSARSNKIGRASCRERV